MNARIRRVALVVAAVIGVGGPLAAAAPANAATPIHCSFSHGHSQQPAGLNVWLVSVHNGAGCDGPLEYASVATALMVSGTSLASGSSTCNMCPGTTAKAGPVPVQSGKTVTNHGTWDLIAASGFTWTTWPPYCTRPTTRELICVRDGHFVVGKSTDLDGLGIDVGTLSIGT